MLAFLLLKWNKDVLTSYIITSLLYMLTQENKQEIFGMTWDDDSQLYLLLLVRQDPLISSKLQFYYL